MKDCHYQQTLQRFTLQHVKVSEKHCRPTKDEGIINPFNDTLTVRISRLSHWSHIITLARISSQSINKQTTQTMFTYEYNIFKTLRRYYLTVIVIYNVLQE